MTGIDVLARTLPSLGLIVGALLILRAWAQRGQRGTDAGIRVVTRTGLAKGAVVAVVAVGQRRLLVGASEHGVSLLTELEPEAELQPTAAAGPATVTAAPAPLGGGAARELGARLGGWGMRSRPRTRPAAMSLTTDRPRMAPIDRLRALTVRRAVSSHPRGSTGVHRRT